MKKLPGIPSFMQNEPLKVWCWGWQLREDRIISSALQIGVKVSIAKDYYLFGLIKVLTIEYWGKSEDIPMFKASI